jgi:hypothetical protein
VGIFTGAKEKCLLASNAGKKYMSRICKRQTIKIIFVIWIALIFGRAETKPFILARFAAMNLGNPHLIASMII